MTRWADCREQLARAGAQRAAIEALELLEQHDIPFQLSWHHDRRPFTDHLCLRLGAVKPTPPLSPAQRVQAVMDGLEHAYVARVDAPNYASPKLDPGFDMVVALPESYLRIVSSIDKVLDSEGGGLDLLDAAGFSAAAVAIVPPPPPEEARRAAGSLLGAIASSVAYPVFAVAVVATFGAGAVDCVATGGPPAKVAGIFFGLALFMAAAGFAMHVADSAAGLLDRVFVVRPGVTGSGRKGRIARLAIAALAIAAAGLCIAALSGMPGNHADELIAVGTVAAVCSAVAGGVLMSWRSAVRQAEVLAAMVLRPFEPPILGPTNTGLRIAHLSDLHVTATPDEQLVERVASGNRTLERVLTSGAESLRDSDVIVLTGDLTDAGTPAQWAQVFTMLPPELWARSIVLPGNHDVNITSASYLDVDDDHGVLRARRVLSSIQAIDLVQGSRAHIVRGSRVVLLRDLLATYRHALYDFADLSRPGDYFVMDDPDHDAWCGPWDPRVPLPLWLWPRMFPMAVPHGDVVFYVLDTTGRSFSMLDNALGSLGHRCLVQLDRLMRHFEGKAAVILLHHHVCLPDRRTDIGLKQAAKTAMMVLEDAPALVQALAGDRQIAVFHGHRHYSYVGRLANLTIVSAPSTSLGDSVHGTSAGFYRYQMSVSASGVTLDSRSWHD